MNFKALTAAAAVVVCCMGNAVNAQTHKNAADFLNHHNNLVDQLHANAVGSPAFCEAAQAIVDNHRDNSWLGESRTGTRLNGIYREIGTIGLRDLKKCEPKQPVKTIAQQQQELNEVLGILSQLNGNSSSRVEVTRGRAEAFCASKGGRLTSYDRYQINCTTYHGGGATSIGVYTHGEVQRAGY